MNSSFSKEFAHHEKPLEGVAFRMGGWEELRAWVRRTEAGL
jgi:hypothetical protein